jgi:hypothetical protein
MSVMDVVACFWRRSRESSWALRMRWSALAMLVGLAFVIMSVVLWGYSVDNYSNNDCQPGEPCPTGERVIE